MDERAFVRLGDLPADGRSRDHYHGRHEAGVSVFPCIKAPEGGYVFDPKGNTILRDNFYAVRDRPAYEVRGRVVGAGRRGGEPVLADVEIVRWNPPHALSCTAPKPPGFDLVRAVVRLGQIVGR